MSAGPELLARATVAGKDGGWYLPRGSSRWRSVAAEPPRLSAGHRCWWSPEPPPGNGWWRPRGPRGAA